MLGPQFPPRRFYNRRAPRGVEMIGMSGVVADYHVHCHVTLDRDGAFGGHLEEGCRVLSLAEIAILRLRRLKMKRTLDPATGQELLRMVSGYDGDGLDQGSLVAVQKRLVHSQGGFASSRRLSRSTDSSSRSQPRGRRSKRSRGRPAAGTQVGESDPVTPLAPGR